MFRLSLSSYDNRGLLCLPLKKISILHHFVGLMMRKSSMFMMEPSCSQNRKGCYTSMIDPNLSPTTCSPPPILPPDAVALPHSEPPT